MIWIILLSMGFALNISGFENASVPFFSDERINVYLEGVGEYGIIVKAHRVVYVGELLPEPTVKIYLSEKAISYYEQLISQDLPKVEKREKAIKYLKENLDKEIRIDFLGWSGIFKLLLLKLYLMVV